MDLFRDWRTHCNAIYFYYLEKVQRQTLCSVHATITLGHENKRKLETAPVTESDYQNLEREVTNNEQWSF